MKLQMNYRSLVHEHKHDPNYQHRDLDPQTFLRNAVISFRRLPEKTTATSH